MYATHKWPWKFKVFTKLVKQVFFSSVQLLKKMTNAEGRELLHLMQLPLVISR